MPDFTCPASPVVSTGNSFENSPSPFYLHCQKYSLPLSPQGKWANQAGLSVNSVLLTWRLVRGEHMIKAIILFWDLIWMLGEDFSPSEITSIKNDVTWSVRLSPLPLCGESLSEHEMDPRGRRA